ncbi:MAG: hypothetical protein OXF79_12115 [Chloroflexi bacterium]|nr:hypothetical protein [Chloroflexota bacterium]
MTTDSKSALPYPFPTQPGARSADPVDPVDPMPMPDPDTSITVTAQGLADFLNIELPFAEELLAAAIDRVDDYAPKAKTALKNRAVTMFAGYMAQADGGAVQRDTLGPMTVDWVTSHGSAFRNSGAAAMLSRYRRRRGSAA